MAVQLADDKQRFGELHVVNLNLTRSVETVFFFMLSVVGVPEFVEPDMWRLVDHGLM